MANVYPGVAEEYAFLSKNGKVYYSRNTTGLDDEKDVIEITQISNIVKVGVCAYDSDYSDPSSRKGSVLVAIDKDGNCYDVRKLYEEIKK